MKYAYACAGIFLVLVGILCFTYSKGYSAGVNSVKSELYTTTQIQAQATVQASRKILDFQKNISNNNDECFNRVWDDDIIDSVNILR